MSMRNAALKTACFGTACASRREQEVEAISRSVRALESEGGRGGRDLASTLVDDSEYLEGHAVSFENNMT